MAKYRKLVGLMAENGYSQVKLAKYLGISRMSISQKINGKQKFNLDECMKLKELFKEPLDYIFLVD